jgi:hypothetical protein
MRTPNKINRICQEIRSRDLCSIIDEQTDLVHLPMVNRHTTPDTDLAIIAEDNVEVWSQFINEYLYDTRRVTLKHFHLFEWFPLKPGKFHTEEASGYRGRAERQLRRSADGETYFNPYGKASMVQGGIGAVRLRPRQIGGELHYFMTASSNGVCHEGFPVLIPRRFFGRLKQRILGEGAAPVTLSGEMRYIPNDILTFLGRDREIPLLYLHVDEIQQLPKPRSEITTYKVSVAISFFGQVEERKGNYVTYANFDPASPSSFERACHWLKQFYVRQYEGTIITDFDEVQPRFPEAIFGLPTLMTGKIDKNQVQAFLQSQGWGEKTGEQFFIVYGDYINVGNITNSESIAIGSNAQATLMKNQGVS